MCCAGRVPTARRFSQIFGIFQIYTHGREGRLLLNGEDFEADVTGQVPEQRGRNLHREGFLVAGDKDARVFRMGVPLWGAEVEMRLRREMRVIFTGGVSVVFRVHTGGSPAW